MQPPQTLAPDISHQEEKFQTTTIVSTVNMKSIKMDGWELSLNTM